MGDDWDYQVRHRAYELWNEAGRPDGKHQQFWEAAEQELMRRRAKEDPRIDDNDTEILGERPSDAPGGDGR